MKTFLTNHRNFNLFLFVVFFSLFACYTSNAQGVGIGVAAPAAILHLKAGTAVASTAPLRFTTGGAALLTTPVEGAMEVLGDALYYTGSTATRRQVSTTTGNETFTGDKTFYGRAMLPMGEVSYFDMTGTTVTISSVSDGASNMVACHPASTIVNDLEFDNGGSNNGQLRYIGAVTKVFHVACTISAVPVTANQTLVFGIARNGSIIQSSKVLQKFSGSTDVQSTALHVMVTLAQNQYLEFFVGNTTSGSGITVKSMCLFALGM